jgi:hypothetical protein
MVLYSDVYVVIHDIKDSTTAKSHIGNPGQLNTSVECCYITLILYLN